MSNTKLTNAQLAQIVETQRETMGVIKMRISKLSDQLAMVQEDVERFKNAVARDVTYLTERVDG